MTPETETRSAVSETTELADHLSALVRLEFELLMIEVGRKLRAGALAAGLGLASLLLLPLLVGFVLATGVVALATVLPLWLSLLAGSAILLLVVGATGLVAGLLLRSLTRPPHRAQPVDGARG